MHRDQSWSLPVVDFAIRMTLAHPFCENRAICSSVGGKLPITDSRLRPAKIKYSWETEYPVCVGRPEGFARTQIVPRSRPANVSLRTKLNSLCCSSSIAAMRYAVFGQQGSRQAITRSSMRVHPARRLVAILIIDSRSVRVVRWIDVDAVSPVLGTGSCIRSRAWKFSLWNSNPSVSRSRSADRFN